MKFTATEHAGPRRLRTRMEGGMAGTFDWTLEPRNGGAEGTARIDYQVPGGILSLAVDALFMERMNEKHAEHMLETLKLLAEAS